MRWLEVTLADRWWSTRTAVRVVEAGRPVGAMTYGELLARAAGLAAALSARTAGQESPHVAVVAADGPAHLVADLAGLIAGTVVVSVPLPRRPGAGALLWPAGVRDDIDVVLADAPGLAAVRRDARGAGRGGPWEVLAIPLEAARTVAVAPELGGEQDDVCKVVFLDGRAVRRPLALTGYALDTVVSALGREEPATGRGPAAHSMTDLARQLQVYRTLALGDAVVFHAARADGGRPHPWRPAVHLPHADTAQASAPVEAVAGDVAISGLIRELIALEPVYADRPVRALRPVQVSA